MPFSITAGLERGVLSKTIQGRNRLQDPDGYIYQQYAPNHWRCQMSRRALYRCKAKVKAHGEWIIWRTRDHNHMSSDQ